jgi:chaperone required for assembly of F1-ATPase
MTEWMRGRFWKETAVAAEAEGYGVTLDGKPIRTPGRLPLRLPTRALATQVAAEWEAQGERIEPASMPFTRLSNSAVERVAPQHAAVAEIVAAYGETDLLCYRAEGPAALARRQARAWDPLLRWAEEAHGARLIPVAGVMFQEQPAAAVARLRAAVDACDPFALTALHELTALSGSLVIGLAVTAGAIGPDAAWAASRTDEIWQAEQWGEDSEALRVAEHKKAEFLQAARFFSLSRLPNGESE